MTEGEQLKALDYSPAPTLREIRRQRGRRVILGDVSPSTLLRRTRIFKGSSLLSFKDCAVALNVRQRYWMHVNLLTKAKMLDREISECERIDDLDREFFRPFNAHLEVERITQNVCKQTPIKKYETLLNRIKSELRQSWACPSFS